jgi:hypothetical protein
VVGKTEAFLNYSIASKPAMVRRAVSKDWKPSILGMFFRPEMAASRFPAEDAW